MLVSGGLDSAVALAEAAREGPVAPVFVRSGLVWEPAEMYWLERFLQTIGAPALVVLELPVGDLYGDHWSLTGDDPPGRREPRRSRLSAGPEPAAAGEGRRVGGGGGCGAIVMGPLAANPFPDGTRAFFDTMAEAIGRAMGRDAPLPIETPLSGLTKAEVVRRAAGLPVELTFSCLNPTPDFRHCGACNKCAERKQGFAKAGVPDPTEYAYGSRAGAGST